MRAWSFFPLSLLSTHCSLSCQVATKTGAFTRNTQMICNLFCIITIQTAIWQHTRSQLPFEFEFNNCFQTKSFEYHKFYSRDAIYCDKIVIKMEYMRFVVLKTDIALTRSYLHKLNAMLIRLIKEAANIWCLITTAFLLHTIFCRLPKWSVSVWRGFYSF